MVRRVLVPLGATRAQRWLDTRTFHHSAFPPDRLAVERDATVSVCVPARECAATIGPLVTELLGLVEAGAIDEVLVVDAGSADGTAALAAAAGARVVSEPGLGLARGNGDAMRRGLAATTGDVVAVLDGDAGGFGAHAACGVVGPIVCEPGAAFCTGFCAGGGDRVTELTARPLLRRFWPDLAVVCHPLGGNLAGRRALLERHPLAPGHGAGIGLLLDVHADVGLRGMAQTELAERSIAHRPLADLGAMADDVLAAVTRRLEAEGRLTP